MAGTQSQPGPSSASPAAGPATAASASPDIAAPLAAEPPPAPPPPPAQWQPLPIRSSLSDLLTGAVPSLFLGLLSSYGLRDPARVLSIHRFVPAAEDIAEFLIPFPLAHWQL